MDYKELVLKSFRIAWNHKWLWVFGFFAGGATVTPNWNLNFPRSVRRPADIDPAIVEWMKQNSGLIVALAVGLAVLAIIFFALSIIAQGALIGAARALDDEDNVSFGGAFKIGLASFWRLLRFVLLVTAIVLGLILLLSVPVGLAVLSGNHVALILTIALTVLALFLLFIPVWVVGAIVVNFGSRGVVLDGHGAIDGLKSAWRLFRDDAGRSLSIWAISLGLAIAFSVAFMIVLVALLLPLVLAGILTFAGDFNLAALGITVFLGLVVLTVFIVVFSAWRAFLSVYWTLAYRRLTAGNDVGTDRTDEGVDGVDGDTL